ncbi:MAG: hypothetical protein VX815_04460 [Gemmatimonadota bacterium]|nr:hypothetical protein [Gemmatimonadota bacterium]
MTSDVNDDGDAGGSRGGPRRAALVSVLVGAAGSVGAVLITGQGRDQRLLMGIMAVWVFAPFAALVLAHRLAKGWSLTTRTALHYLMLVLALGSMVLYMGDTVREAGGQNAFVFVVVPLVSWVLMVLVISIAAFTSRRRSSGVEQA